MPFYECVILARSEVTQQQAESLAEAIAEDLGPEGGTVRKREYWGLRNLAYRIKKNRKGHYLFLGLEAPHKAVAEMERKLRLNEDVLRFLTVRVKAIEEGPSAIIARRAEDRGFRAPKGGRFDSGRRRPEDDREEFRARGEFRPERDEVALEPEDQ